MSLNPQSILSLPHRDHRILELIKQCKVLSVEQVRAVLFDFKSGYRKANARLLALQRKKLINRGRALSERSYVYYINRPRQIDHQLGLNWVFVWMHKRSPWTRLIKWEYTPDYGILIPDAEATLFNVITEKNQTMFVEFDRDTTIFDKIQLYNDFYESGCYQDAEWAQGPDARFPEVLIVTINHARMQHIIKMINSKNRNGIRFRVKMLDEIRTDSTCKPY